MKSYAITKDGEDHNTGFATLKEAIDWLKDETGLPQSALEEHHDGSWFVVDGEGTEWAIEERDSEERDSEEDDGSKQYDPVYPLGTINGQPTPMMKDDCSPATLDAILTQLAAYNMSGVDLHGYELAQAAKAEAEEQNADEELKQDPPETAQGIVSFWREERDCVRGIGHDAIDAAEYWVARLVKAY